jgi:fluoride exporter
MASAGGGVSRAVLSAELVDESDLSPRVDPRKRARQTQTVIVGALACGGLFGALSRYALSLALPTKSGQFPWGTFLINLTGSLVLGFLLVLLLEQFPRGRLARPVIGTGFLGAYTTFSTFMVETVLLVRDGHVGDAIAYLASSTILGLVAAWTGIAFARLVLRAERWLQEEL